MKWKKIKEYPEIEKAHLALSGGRTSAYMLRIVLDNYAHLFGDFRVLFCNTGKEMDETLDFVHEIETRGSVPVTWLEYARVPATSIDISIFPTKRRASFVKKQAESGVNTHWFREVDYSTAHRNGQPDGPFDELISWMSVLPNHVSRACSSQLKARTMMRHLWSEGFHEFTSFIGFRADESDRGGALAASKDAVPGNDFAFPLIDHGVTESEVMKFWSEQPFDLRLEQYEGNCDLCFEKSKPKRMEIMRRRPELADWWIRQEEESELTCEAGSKFIRKSSYRQVRDEAMSLKVVEDDRPSEGLCGVCTDGTIEWPEDEE